VARAYVTAINRADGRSYRMRGEARDPTWGTLTLATLPRPASLGGGSGDQK
jgi:hypothetical protein